MLASPPRAFVWCFIFHYLFIFHWFVFYVTLVVELSHICDSILRYMVVFVFRRRGRRLVHVFLNPVPLVPWFILSAGMETFAGLFDLLLALHFRYFVLRPFLHSLVMGSVGEFTVLIWVGYTGTPFGVLGIYFELAPRIEDLFGGHRSTVNATKKLFCPYLIWFFFLYCFVL